MHKEKHDYDRTRNNQAGTPREVLTPPIPSPLMPAFGRNVTKNDQRPPGSSS
jgi:hypothetical protein